MDDDKKSDQFDESLQLPIDPQPGDKTDPQDKDDNPAADLVRKKVQAAFDNEPDASTEAHDIEELGLKTKLSKHQQFIQHLTSSGKSLPEIQTDWHEYYAGLSDPEKHEVWQEFYVSHAAATGHEPRVMGPEPLKTTAAHPKDKDQTALRHKLGKHVPAKAKPVLETVGQLKTHVLKRLPRKHHAKTAQPFQSLMFGLGAGALVILVILFSFFNERFIAPFIQPSRTVTNIPLITDTQAATMDPEIIIPKINVQIPVVYDVSSADEEAVLRALEAGVINYADSARPGQNGNVVIVGHSSNNIFNKGKFKFAFVLLSRMETGDTFYLQKDGKRYTYQIYEKRVVKPEEISVLGKKDKPATATLITCDPPGTTTNRLVVVGQQISPEPSSNTAQVTNNVLATGANIVPGNAPSLWSKVLNWFTQ